jgi:hypothetical protein
MAIDVGNIITLNGSYLKHKITCNNKGCSIYFREDTDLKNGLLIVYNKILLSDDSEFITKPIISIDNKDVVAKIALNPVSSFDQWYIELINDNTGVVNFFVI